MMIEKLNKILVSWGSSRAELVSQFQQEIWNNQESDDNPEYQILNDLAYDLDYYEPRPGLRLEDKSFFGDDILQERMNEAIEKLKRISK